MKVLVFGGAGYIGSHTVYELLRAGHKVTIFDDLSTGNTAAIPQGVSLIEGDLRKAADVGGALDTDVFDVVMDFAAKIVVSESVEKPLEYYENNVYGVGVLLDEMRKRHMTRIMFSSTAAVYGEPDTNNAITETGDLKPINPYGDSKRSAEGLIQWVQAAHGIEYVIFRYFNVAGADASGEIGLSPKYPPTHLIPSIVETILGKRSEFKIFGDDYPTLDGTCIRDYIHVTDLAKAHVLGAEYLMETNHSEIINLGTSDGYSVKEILDTAEKTLSTPVNTNIVPRRLGDPAKLVASNELATKILGWKPQLSIEDMIISDYNWRKAPKY